MNSCTTAAGIAAVLLLAGTPVLAQDIPTQESCKKDIRYSDGRTPSADALQIDETLVFKNLPIAVRRNTTIAEACATLLQPSIRIARLELELQEKTDADAYNAEFVRRAETDPIQMRPRHYIWVYSVLNATIAAVVSPLAIFLLMWIFKKRRKKSRFGRQHGRIISSSRL